MHRIAQVNFVKIIVFNIVLLFIKEVIPNYFIQDQALKATYKMIFLGVITILYVAYTIFLFRKKGFSDVNNSVMCGVLGFWTFSAWTQYLGIFR